MRRRALRALWEVGLPAGVSMLVMQGLVPPVAAGGAEAWIAELGRHHAVALAAALFVGFSAIAHYWAPYVLRVSEQHAKRTRGHRRWDAMALGAGMLVAASAAVGLRSMAALYRVDGGSMLPTLAPDDVVLGRRGLYGFDPTRLHRADIVAFPGAALPQGPGAGSWPTMLVKRVLGLPGDRIAMRDDGPVVNGWPVPWCDAGEYAYMLSDPAGRAVHGRLRVEFLEDRAYLTLHTPGPPFEGVYEVKPGEVFVLGDNRGNSLDSRAYAPGGGGVPLSAVQAKVDWFVAGTHRSGATDLRPRAGTSWSRARIRGGTDEEGSTT